MCPAFIGRQAVKLFVAEFVVGEYARNTAEKTREHLEPFYFILSHIWWLGACLLTESRTTLFLSFVFLFCLLMFITLDV